MPERWRFAHHRGNVLFLSRPSRLRLMVVEQGTASRWWELLGSVGTHWLLLLAFCSLLGREYAYTLIEIYTYKYDTIIQRDTCF